MKRRKFLKISSKGAIVMGVAPVYYNTYSKSFFDTPIIESATEFSTEVTIKRQQSHVIISNEFVKVSFDLKKGTFLIADRKDSQARIEGCRYHFTDTAGVTLAGNTMVTYSSSNQDVTGQLGRGKRLTITGAAPGLADLLLETELYEGGNFVVLNAGIVNRTDRPIRLGQIHPIMGTSFKGQNVTEQFAVLDGTTGCLPTNVRTGDQVKCRNNLLARFGNNPVRCLVIGGLTYHDFEKFTRINRRQDSIDIDVWSEDPVGRRVDPGQRYVPDDKVYVDISSTDPFIALEAYARNVRLAQNIELPVYDFPTVCLWWASQVGPLANDTIGAVREMDHIVRSGFLKYSRVGVRLLPDSYDKNNFDGWWDDEHWQKCSPTFAEPGPCYKRPYETTKKWCRAITDRGGIPIGYFRTNGRSDDYAMAFPGHMLFNDPNRQLKHPVGKRWWEKTWPENERDLVGCDFTDPEFIKHMQEVYANLKEAGLAGIFYDYPKITGWCSEGGFEDDFATTASAYRNIFHLAQEGLGKGAYLQERAYFLGSDVSLGLVASQRTIWDNTTWAPPVISRAGLRWYKNRVVMNYDTDGKQILDEYQRNGRDGGRSMLTMTYVASARLIIANSFSQMTPEQLFDISRVIPFHSAPQSARPIDMFSGRPYPSVYDFKIDDSWHQLTFFNTSIEQGEWPTIDVDLEPGTEGRKDFPPKVKAIKPVTGTVAVELGAPPASGGLGLDSARRYYVYDFWNDQLVGVYKGSDKLEQKLRPAETRMMSVHAVEAHPQVISTNRHVMQGYVDMVSYPVWSVEKNVLRGVSKMIGGETYKVVIAGNGRRALNCSADGATAGIGNINEAAGLVELELNAAENCEVAWEVEFNQGEKL